MPTYEYLCEACGHKFDELQSFKDPVLKDCPQCGQPQLRRLFGTGAAILFKGSGFYETDYRSESYKNAAKAFAGTTLAAMKAAPITNPGTTKRPGLPGVQYVGIPAFQDVGNRCTQLFSAVIAGSMKDTAAISQCQQIASQAIR